MIHISAIYTMVNASFFLFQTQTTKTKATNFAFEMIAAIFPIVNHIASRASSTENIVLYIRDPVISGGLTRDNRELWFFYLYSNKMPEAYSAFYSTVGVNYLMSIV